MFPSARRKVPWIVVFEAAMMMRQRWKTLPPADRARLVELARTSTGRPYKLTRQDLITILTEPRNALVKQFQRFFSFDGIELVFSDDSLASIADKALERETGARGLRSILEEVLLDVQFELPSRRDVRKCVITKETITKGLKPTLVTEAARDDDAPAAAAGTA